MPDSQETLAEALARLIKVRSSLKARLTVVRNFVFEINADEPIAVDTLHGLEARLSKLKELYDAFLAAQLDIDILFDEVPDAQIQERTNFENSFYSVDSQMRELLSKNHASLATNSARNNHDISTRIKLPEIRLPSFDGNSANWLTFRDMYESLVHNKNNLNNIEKFHYLRSSLSGEAALMVSSLEFSNNSYIEAWRRLCHRYNNTKDLVNSHIRQIFSFDAMPKACASQIHHILDNLAKHLAALKSLKEPVEHWDTLLIYIIASKLDQVTARKWEEYQLSHSGQITLNILVLFLENKARVMESVDLHRVGNSQSVNTNNNKPRSFRALGQGFGGPSRVLAASYQESSCPACKQNHAISQCNSFLNLSINERLNLAKTLKLCLNCLRPGHFIAMCKSSNCRKCGRKHHTLLHFENRTPSNSAQQPSAPSAEIQTVQTVQLPSAPSATRATSAQPQEQCGVRGVVTATSLTGVRPALLATAMVFVYDRQGQRHYLRALLDSASQSSFVLSAVIERLNLACSPICVPVHGFNQSISYIKKRCEFSIHSCHSSFKFEGNFLVTSSITGSVPACSFNTKCLNLPQGITLADPTFNVPRDIDLLLGADCFWSLILPGQHHLGPNMPMVKNTELGWILAGPLPCYLSRPISCNFARLSLDEQIEKFWKIEDLPNHDADPTQENACETHFCKHTCRTEAGRFVVKIPVVNLEKLGSSYETAHKRYLNIERKLRHNATLREQYNSFIDEYISLGHARKVDSEPLEKTPHYYLPHHAVYNENSSTTKIRVLFDASCKTSTGVSFNDCQLVGPVIQNDIFSILLRFRKHAFVVTADLSKMYRQILVDKSQHSFQRILWRTCPERELEVYELQTVTYGTASASYLATRCLEQLAIENCSSNHMAAQIIKEDFYVDDVLTGMDNADHLLEICRALEKIFAGGCFTLHKWRSNVPCIASKFDIDVTRPQQLLFAGDDSSKTLGLIWNNAHDHFAFNVNIRETSCSITKRGLLSELAQIFDPLGLVAPCLIVGKIIMQKLWLTKLHWDDTLPAEIQENWRRHRADLKRINNFNINRYAFATPKRCEVQLHGFSDASTAAYGACLYIRVTTEQGGVSCNLLCAKTRVAPLKTITIPRLELCAALLLVRLTKLVVKILNVEFSQTILWTDSSIVLAWLRTPPIRLTTFVSNRISEMQQVAFAHSWRHVPTKSNPADMLSRGISAFKLENCTLWWSGPHWLTASEIEWPNLEPNCKEVRIPEQRKIFTQSLIAKIEPVIDWNRFSTFDKLCRVVVYVNHFIARCKKSVKKDSLIFTLPNLNFAELLIVKLIQRQDLLPEFKALRGGRAIPAASSLHRLSPFLGNDELIRVGGRLNNAALPDAQKHQIILPKHCVTALIFRREHRRLLHIAPLGLLNSIRQRYWPMSGRNLAKQIVFQCTTCFRANPKAFEVPIMGQLPNSRVTPAAPFSHCGIDYAGPVELKANTLRNSKSYKAYIALFVCMCTEAVHLELLTSLSTEAFLAMFKRFYSRRGMPSHVYSDNATNFVGANLELKKFFKQNANIIMSSCTAINVSWHFIPPRSPHFGGIWEAGVKSTKYHLKRVIGTRSLTFENFTTLLAQVEAILNSRPLSPLSSDPNDLSPLTPGHFLIGRPLTALPEEVACVPDNRLSKFQQIQAMMEGFWRLWTRDYINTLQQKTRWTRSGGRVPAVGQLVLVKDDNTPVMQWLLGRITTLHPGADDVTRVATVKTRNGDFKRAIIKLCPLPTGRNIEGMEEEDSTEEARENETQKETENERDKLLQIIITLTASAEVQDFFNCRRILFL